MMSEVEVLEGALAAFAESGFSSGQYWPDGSGGPADGYCAWGGLVKAAGGIPLNCFTDFGGDNRRACFLERHPEVVRAHARLEAHLGLTFDELSARAVVDHGDRTTHQLLHSYGGSLLEFWVEECLPPAAEVVGLFERALAEARADAAVLANNEEGEACSATMA